MFPQGSVIPVEDWGEAGTLSTEQIYSEPPEDFEEEELATLEEYLEWEEILQRSEDGGRFLAAAKFRPGQLTGAPGCGSHAPGSSCYLSSISRRNGCSPGTSPCNWQSVNGYDVYMYPGTPVLAPLGGVCYVGSSGYGDRSDTGRMGGMRIHIRHPNGMHSYLSHMRQLIVAAGRQVQAGQILGYSGIANSFPHTHYACTPPFNPALYAPRIYNKNARRNPTVPAPGGVAPPAALVPSLNPPPRTLEQAWEELMRSRMQGKRNRTAQLELVARKIKDITL